MKKPNNYDETPVQGEFTPVELGGHRLIIKEVEETQSKNGKDMLIVRFDFAPDDKQPKYFEKQFADDIRPDKKWPNQATQYIVAVDNDNNTSKSLKTFCTCIENSNTGFKCWTEDGTFKTQELAGKRLGGVFGEQMDFYNDKETKKRVLRWFTSIDKVADAAIPELSETQAYKNHKGGFPTGAVPAGDGFMNIPNDADDELPFN